MSTQENFNNIYYEFVMKSITFAVFECWFIKQVSNNVINKGRYDCKRYCILKLVNHVSYS